VLFFDDFEYDVARDGGDPEANLAAFEAAGWSWAKANNLPTAAHNGYLYTVSSIPGYAGPFPGAASDHVLAIEARAATFGGQTDFYLQYGGEPEDIPGDVWYQFWVYINDDGEQRSQFSVRDKLLYVCRGDYPCSDLHYLVFWGNTNPPTWIPDFGVGANERFLMVYESEISLPDGLEPKLGHNLDATTHFVPNRWMLAKLHFDTSTSSGLYEAWMRPMDGEFTQVAEWRDGRDGATWTITAPGGHRTLRIPTTLPGANNDQYYDSWVYLDDFAMATAEDRLPVYP
jgi:hypothetical protein